MLCEDLTTAQVLDLFHEEIAAHRGQVTDTFDDGARLFVRSVLPEIDVVRPKDKVQAGVALKAASEGVWVYPYIFRQVCRNGAIVAETLDSRPVAQPHVLDAESALHCVRTAIVACCAREVFQIAVGNMRKACTTDIDIALTMMPLVARLATRGNEDLLRMVMRQFFGNDDRSQYGLANAVTAVARDTRDPALRWDLEELGGGLAVGGSPSFSPDEGQALFVRHEELVVVG